MNVGGADSVLLPLIIANVVLFFLAGPRSLLSGHLSLSLHDLTSFQVWRLVTYGFCHGSFEHLFWNMFFLWMFGRMVEPIYGAREFLAFYLMGIFISGVCHIGFQAMEQSPAGVIGASGGVQAVVFLTAMNFPRMVVYVMFVLPLELRWLAVLYAIGDMMGLAQGGSPVAHAAHLGGAVFGIAYQHYGWRVLSWLPSGKKLRSPTRRQPQVRVYSPPEEDRQQLDVEVDRILQKISEQGESSLTARERETLKQASQQYKHRNHS